MANEILLVLSTFPDAATAQRVAQQLIEEKCAACANILPGIESIYRWQGKVEQTRETIVYFKVTSAGFELFQASLRRLHPYEVPEIIGLAIARGLPDYLRWVATNCQ